MSQLDPIEWIGRKKSGGKTERAKAVTYHQARVAIAEKLGCVFDAVEVRVLRDSDRKAVAAE